MVFSFLVFGITCKKTGEQKADTGISQKETESSESLKPVGKGRRMGQSDKAVGKGYGRKALGKRAGRAWGEIEVVELSDEEKEAIEIETVTASYKPLRSQLQAMGKVLAHPLRKAIVSYAFSARISQIHVRIGDWVKAGQELVTLQSEEVGTAKSEFYKAMADHELAKMNFSRFGLTINASLTTLVTARKFVSYTSLGCEKLYSTDVCAAKCTIISGCVFSKILCKASGSLISP